MSNLLLPLAKMMTESPSFSSRSHFSSAPPPSTTSPPLIAGKTVDVEVERVS